MSYAHSHLYPGADMIALLIVATSLFSPPLDVLYFVWFMFVIGFALLFVPFLYNPNTLQLATLRRDWRLWAEWVSAEHSAAAGGRGRGHRPGRVVVRLVGARHQGLRCVRRGGAHLVALLRRGLRLPGRLHLRRAVVPLQGGRQAPHHRRGGHRRARGRLLPLAAAAAARARAFRLVRARRDGAAAPAVARGRPRTVRRGVGAGCLGARLLLAGPPRGAYGHPGARLLSLIHI